MKKFLVVIANLLCLSFVAQISVINTPFQTFNVTPNSLVQASIMNAGAEQQVYLQSKLYNASNEIIMSTTSAPFLLHNGVNTSVNSARQVQHAEYGSNNQAGYIQTSHQLPGGRFKLCVVIISASTSEVIDDFCEEIEADLTQFLYLVSPFDKDTIPNSQPLLVWTHSEPFSVLSQGESYRLVLVELKNNQSAEEGVVSNPTHFMKNNLTTHEVLYPVDANKLEGGKRYGWQVQKVSNDIVINKSEAWEFTLATKTSSSIQCAVLQKKLDASYYTVINNKLQFRFVEDYNTSEVVAKIFDSKGQLIKAKVKGDEEKRMNGIQLKSNGYNLFEIDMNSLNIQNGFHVLEVKNQKGEVYKLKFLIQE